MPLAIAPIEGTPAIATNVPGIWFVSSSSIQSTLKCNFTASVAPTANDDTSDGYSIGSLWIDIVEDKVYVCVDSTVGFAVWVILSPDTAPRVDITDTSDSTCWVCVVDEQTGELAVKTDGGLTYDSTTGTLTATRFELDNGAVTHEFRNNGTAGVVLYLWDGNYQIAFLYPEVRFQSPYLTLGTPFGETFAGAATLKSLNGGDLNLSSYNDVVSIGGGVAATELRFLEPSGSGTNYTALKAQAQAGDITYTLPAADGSSGQVLRTNGSGLWSWANASDVAETSNAPSGTTQTINWTSSLDQKLDLSGASGTVTLTFDNPPTTGHLLLKIVQGGSAKDINWPASVKWDDVIGEPVWTGDTNKTRLVGFYYDGTTYFAAASDTYT